MQIILGFGWFLIIIIAIMVLWWWLSDRQKGEV